MISAHRIAKRFICEQLEINEQIPLSTRAKSLSKMLRIVENERFTFDIDPENAILDCTLER